MTTMNSSSAVGETKPVAAFALSAVGLAFQGIAALLFLLYLISFFFSSSSNYNGYFGYGMMGPWMMMFGVWPWARFGIFSAYWLVAFFIIFAAVEIALGVVGVLWMNSSPSSKMERIRTGSVLVLVASIFAFPTMWGFMIGSLLMFIGSILGLTWQSPQIKYQV